MCNLLIFVTYCKLRVTNLKLGILPCTNQHGLPSRKTGFEHAVRSENKMGDTNKDDSQYGVDIQLDVARAIAGERVRVRGPGSAGSATTASAARDVAQDRVVGRVVSRAPTRSSVGWGPGRYQISPSERGPVRIGEVSAESAGRE